MLFLRCSLYTTLAIHISSDSDTLEKKKSFSGFQKYDRLLRKREVSYIYFETEVLVLMC